MEKKKYSRVTITFDAGSRELKERAIKLARNFQPVCQVALREYIKKNEGEIRK